jgi:signal transduction histidine kinase
MRRHPYMVDGVITVALFAVVAAPGALRGHQQAPAILIAAATFGVLILRRRWPVPVFVAATAGAEFYMVLTQAGTGALAAPMIALYTLAEGTSRRGALIVGGLAVLVMAWVHALVGQSKWAGSDNVALVALGALAVAAGDAARVRRAYIAEVEQRARQAEQSRRQEAERRVTEERLRLARDLHDVLGHQIALINVQAGVAADVLDDRPDQAREALTHIKQAGRAALDELRDTVGLLRQPGDPSAPTEPTEGLADLRKLVASFNRSGLRIEHVVAGRVRPVPPAADLTAYRVIQESLTNVSKHAGSQTATVRIDYRPTALHIVVEDEGSGPAQPPPASAGNGADNRAGSGTGNEGGNGDHDVTGSKADGRTGDSAGNGAGNAAGNGAGSGVGNGIAGMRERVAAIGGTLRAGPRPGAGFRVSARLPLPAGDRT